MSRSRGFSTNDLVNGISFSNLDDVQPPMRRLSPLDLRSDSDLYQNGDRRYPQRSPNPKAKRSGFCSKYCFIGLLIGFLIGGGIVTAIVVPLYLTKPCATNTTSNNSCIGTISSTPYWNGTFLMDNQCDTSHCCCLTNQIQLTQIIGNQILINGSVIGQCSVVGIGISVSLVAPLPTGFQTGLFWNSEPIRIQMGLDNSYLSFVNIPNGGCTATAIRTS